jgi:hypothetical protein
MAIQTVKETTIQMYIDSTPHFSEAEIGQMLEVQFENEHDAMVKRKKELTSKAVLFPYKHFSPFVVEVKDAYVHGLYFSVISGSQSLIEAMIRDLCHSISTTGWKNDFGKQVKQLKTRFPQCPKRLFEIVVGIYEHRNDFHHLNPSTPIDREKLRVMALEKIKFILEAMEILYPYEIKQGKIIPKTNLWYTNKPVN